jgi:predicted GH43/DUF377 family glycosyl hydrolase
MKTNYILFLFFFSILLLIGCKKENTLQPELNQGTGSLALLLDKTNAPEDVVVVTAKLTRDNHDPIVQNLNLLSDTSASITFPSILAGQWLLQVDAKDSADQVLYTGQAQVNVVANTTTNVSLVLQPVQNNVGNIFIYVTWGGQNLSWFDYANNPILVPTNSYEVHSAWMAVVLKDQNKYRMWYGGLVNSAVNYGLYAESTDGLNWIKPFSSPILSPGYGGWDYGTVRPGAVIKDGSIYRMYYTGWESHYSKWHIGMATSTDGLNWAKHSSPVLLGTSDWEYQVQVSSVLKYNGIYYMYYSGKYQANYVYRIGVATSTDGINWTRYSGNPILIPSSPWEGNTIWGASVLITNGQFRMVYNSNGAFGWAFSNDGFNWTKSSTNPFFTKSNTVNGWGTDDIAFPNYLIVDNKEYIYYSAAKTKFFYRTGVLIKE